MGSVSNADDIKKFTPTADDVKADTPQSDDSVGIDVQGTEILTETPVDDVTKDNVISDQEKAQPN